MNKKILTNTIILVLLVTTTSMTIPLVYAQQNNTQKLQDLFKSQEFQSLIGPSDRVITAICPADRAVDCQVFEGAQTGGPIDPQGNLMAQGDQIFSSVCPQAATALNQCENFRGTPITVP